MGIRILVAIFLYALGAPGVAVAQHRLDDGLRDLAAQVASRTSEQNLRRVAVVPFRELDGRQTVLGSYLAESMTTRLFNLPGLRVIERAMLDKVMAELKLASTGAIDTTTAAQIGRLLGAEAIVTGSLTDLPTSVAINCRMIDVATGEVYGAAEVRILKDDDLMVLNRSAPGELGAGYADARIVATKDLDYLRVTIRTVERLTAPVGRSGTQGIRIVLELQNRERQQSIVVGVNGAPLLPSNQSDSAPPLLRASLLDDTGGAWSLPAASISGLGYVRAGVYGNRGQQVYSPSEIGRLLQLRDRLGRDDNDPSDGSREQPPGWVTPYGAPRQSFYPFTGNRFVAGDLTTIAPGATAVVTMDFASGRSASGVSTLQVNLEFVTGAGDPGGARAYHLRSVVFDKVLMPRAQAPTDIRPRLFTTRLFNVPGSLVVARTLF